MPKKRTTKKKVAAKSNGANGRRENGQFAPGHPGGPGNPHIARLAEYRKALNAALSPDMVKNVTRKLYRLAMAGDVQAAKVVLERALGKVKEAPNTVIPIDVGTLDTTEDVKRASSAILKAMARGDITADDATRYAYLVELVRRAIETHELEIELEEHAEIIKREEDRVGGGP